MANKTIVVANDDPIYLDVIKELLTEEGYPSIRCFVGGEVFEEIRKEGPDLILLDISMAQPATGWRTLDMLRLQSATAQIPVIVCSTDPWLLRDKAEHLQTLCCDTLEKPFNLEMLLAKVRAAIGPPPERR